MQYERLRRTTESILAQEAARYALRHAYNMWMSRAGRSYRADEYQNEKPSAKLEKSVTKLYEEIRKELGVASPDAVFPEPPD